MEIPGAYPGDIARCLFGNDREACERVIFGYYLYPRLQRELELLKLPPTPPIPGPPGPDPTALLHELMLVLLAPSLGETSLRSHLDPGLRMEATIKFRDGLQKLVDELDKEIEQLSQMPVR